MSIYSTYSDHLNSLVSYVVHLSWSENGLVLQKEYLPNSPIPNLKVNLKTEQKAVTGTKIVLDCTRHYLSNENIQRMKDQLYKLFPIEGATIYLNSVPLNSKYDDIVTISLSNTGIMIDDNATGISDETLIRSLLVPSSSTKQRVNEDEPYREPTLFNFSRNELNIIVNGVCINNIRLEITIIKKNMHLTFICHIIVNCQCLEITLYMKQMRLMSL